MDREEIERSLDAFERDPRAAMGRIPQKRNREGTAIMAPSAFTLEDIRSSDFVLAKDAVRRRFYTVRRGAMISLGEVIPGRAPIGIEDRPEDLVDTFRYARLEDIDAAGLANATLAVTPWSSDYWPTYLGLLGRRYADPKFPGAQKWDKNYEYVNAHPAADILRSGNAAAIDLLSPSEKYDLLVEEGSGSLTATMWNEGKSYFERDGKVEPWMGICDGWAVASYMLPRPRHVATALAADGKTVLRFYPDDIKALIALLWAKARTPVKFIGTRNDEKKPKLDENGRLIDPAAFDSNPGTFHLAAVNQIGVSRRPFIMDTTYDYEVWNQPIFAYEYQYFNPQTMKAAPDLRSATVQRGEFTRDRFKKYRSADATAVVGVYMRIRYVGETQPDHATTDSPENDKHVSVDYVYDLELDAGGKILGGEWYQNAHPDFLWTPAPGARAVTAADPSASGQWDTSKPLPLSWQKAAARASRNMLPLAKIIDRLILMANN